ncbi:MAG: winged helix-turn-helix transcriptional regulator [Alphaproteobacteria bacterium]|nr:winged helix-turn-helix domain-containing protein [Alphaproteobacteria bacterium]MDE2111753.1 winged helix-turn-helix transcriptional regulator [Alphaproteobacteria bacterium]MDE2494918.1 winged helix-turn-helix transcriptional regulator [Alphaproteobacteria bacterium]
MNLDHTFAALADPTRRAILARLALGEATAGELASPFAISQPAISRHLKVLEDASLIARIRDGQHMRCRLLPEALKSANDWLAFYSRFWSESFDRLDEHLKQEGSDDE